MKSSFGMCSRAASAGAAHLLTCFLCTCILCLTLLTMHVQPHTHTHTHDMLLVYVCVCNTYCNLLYYIACTTIHTPCATEQALGLVEIGSVDRDFNFTYLPGEEENSWPGRLWQRESASTVSCLAVTIVCHVQEKLVTFTLSSPPYWLPGGVIPYDGVPLEQVVSVHLSVTVIFSVLATAGITFAVACLIFNFIFRNRKYVAMKVYWSQLWRRLCRELKSLICELLVNTLASLTTWSLLPQTDSSQQLQSELLDRVWSSLFVHEYLFLHRSYHWPTSCGCTVQRKFIIDVA